jgi:Fe(3+) dicitrate transport protein
MRIRVATVLALFATSAWAQPEPAPAVAAPVPVVAPLPEPPAAQAEPEGANEAQPSNPTLNDVVAVPFTPAAPPAGAVPAGPVDPEALDGSATIIGDAADRARVSGSAYAVPKAVLEVTEYDDIQRVLNRVPGVNVRGEDGVGLRPNIGIRGANSERSQKVTLLEDGVLFGPAPYSAPAAYYFPRTTRMVGVEVIKGPSAIQHGPQTIGGALNLQSRAVPGAGHQGGIDVAAGQFGYGKTHGHWGWGGERFGVLLEGVRIQSTGFKTIGGNSTSGGDNSGFGITEAMLKARYNTDPNADVFQRFDLKLLVTDEQSYETYLGLSRTDFDADPYQRYAASDRGYMDSLRYSGTLGHTLEWGDAFSLRTTAYRHQLSRAWTKFNRFGSPAIQANPQQGSPIDTHALLRGDPTGRAGLYRDVLAGKVDTDVAAGGATAGISDYDLMIGTNDRAYVSQGIQTSARIKLGKGAVTQSIEAGARLHHDQIRRDQYEDPYRMVNGTTVRREGVDTLQTTLNEDNAYAIAAWALDEIGLGKSVFLRPGVRVEHITTERSDRTPRVDAGTGDAVPFPEDQQNTNTAVMPGAGVYWQATDWLGVLGGVHRGFSPVAPGQPGGVSPEYAINSEAGLRFSLPWIHGEAIGFLNQYSNIVGNCSFSAGCADGAAGAQFNGGDANIYGLEAVVGGRRDLRPGLALTFDLSYTFTHSEFQSDFESSFPQWGKVTAGDEMPYLPKHQLFAALGLIHRQFGVDVSAQYVGEQRDVAGHGAIVKEERIDAYTVVDAGARWLFTPMNQLYLRCNNLLDSVYATSMRPFGLRPGLPRQVILGYKHDFGG